MLNSDIRTTRYYKKLNLDYPNMTIKFIPTNENYADFLTRHFDANKQEIARVKLPKFKVKDLSTYIPKDTTFTLREWKAWVDNNPNHLQEVKNANDIKLQLKVNLINLYKQANIEISNIKGKSVFPKTIDGFKIRQPKINLNNFTPPQPPNNTAPITIKQPKVMLEKLKPLENIVPVTIKQPKVNLKKVKPPSDLEEDDEYDILQRNTELQNEPKPSELIYVDHSPELAVVRTMTPINILHERLSIENIIKGQREEYENIYVQCMKNIGKPTNVDGDIYEINKGVIMYIDENNIPKPLLPTKLVGVAIVYYHLSAGHAGFERLYLNISFYYHKKLMATTRKFTQACYSCALVNKGTKQQKIGYYPTVKYPFQLVYMDLIESLPKIQGCEDALMVCCGLTGAIFGFPLPSKTAGQFIFTFMNVIYQIFQPTQILTDNAKIFRQYSNLKMLAALNVEVFFCSANDPASKGQIEQSNKLIKYIIKKEIVNLNAQDWLHLLPLVTTMYNTHKIPKHNYSPFELLFGFNRNRCDIMNISDEPYLHQNIQTDREEVKQIRRENTQKLQAARNIIIKNKIKRLHETNKNRINKKFKLGQPIFIKRFPKRYVKETFQPFFDYSPWYITGIHGGKVVAKHSSSMAVTRVSNNLVKVIKPQDKEFSSLPLEVQQIISAPLFTPINSAQMKKLMKNDPFDFMNYEEELIDPNDDILPDDEVESDPEDEQFFNTTKTVSFKDDLTKPL